MLAWEVVEALESVVVAVGVVVALALAGVAMVGVSVVAAWATGSSIMFENKKTPEETATETTPILNRRSDQRV